MRRCSSIILWAACGLISSCTKPPAAEGASSVATTYAEETSSLIAKLSDPKVDVRVSAAQSLEKSTDPARLGPLEKAATADPEPGSLAASSPVTRTVALWARCSRGGRSSTLRRSSIQPSPRCSEESAAVAPANWACVRDGTVWALVEYWSCGSR